MTISNTQRRAAVMMIDVIEANRSRAQKPHLIPQIDAYAKQTQTDVERLLRRTGETLPIGVLKRVWAEQKQARRDAAENKRRAAEERRLHQLELARVERGGRRVIDLGKLGQLDA